MKSHATAIVWLRRDLRLTDNPALRRAVQQADEVIPVFIDDANNDAPWSPGAASRWWLHHSLTALSRALDARGGTLVVRRGEALEILKELISATETTLVTWNRLYEPSAVRRDTQIKAGLQEAGVTVESFNAALLLEPWAILNQQGQPYRVFTPYWRAMQARLGELPPPSSAPRKVPRPRRRVETLAIGALELLPRIRWDSGLGEHWTPGEAGALKRLKAFGKQLAQYGTHRDRPDLAGTSRLSPHLHFGEIGPRQIVAALHSNGATRGGHGSRVAYVRELGWREFAHHLMFHFPDTPEQPLDRRYAALTWRNDAHLLRAWQRGLTGYPIVDAGMRELWATGWMHNRVRMIVASLLTKNLQIHWLEGARWFWNTLVDADLANNTLGWQWDRGMRRRCFTVLPDIQPHAANGTLRS